MKAQIFLTEEDTSSHSLIDKYLQMPTATTSNSTDGVTVEAPLHTTVQNAQLL